MTRISLQDSNLETAVYRSLGLPVLLHLMQADRKYRILDLGPALGTNVDFWSQFLCRLTIEDFYCSYKERTSSGPDDSKERIFAELLPFNDETRFDIILAWDLFNYLNLEELEAFARHLSRQCSRGSLLFVLISSAAIIPAEPTIFSIVDRERMTYITRRGETRPCPRYQSRELSKLLPQFEISSSFLLRHGVREYVFIFR
jgi:hypothetical protein